MARAVDVAVYILDKCGTMTAMKLQKLVYYSQAWSLAWDNVPLFDEPIRAWANGPVVRALYDQHKGQYCVTSETFDGDPDLLTDDERDTIDVVLDAYAERTPVELSELTHSERPWRKAREHLLPGERGNRTISRDDMMEYYAALL